MRKNLSLILLITMVMIPYAANGGLKRRQLIELGYKKSDLKPKKISRAPKSTPKKNIKKKPMKPIEQNKKESARWGKWLLKKLTFQG